LSRKWVLDASPLITLGKIFRISLLEKMCSDLVVPGAVAHEIEQGPDTDPARIWVGHEGARLVRQLDRVVPEVLGTDLGKGESLVISWAYLNPDYEAILDDRAARTCALSLGIRVRGTLGVLLLAKREGLLPRVRPLLDQLVESGFRIDSNLLQTVAKLTDEE